ncbi:F-box/LRR-repeat protein 4-like [Oscarella lobularis]|uniref:F-box/LRR-repeat protein 4-like n=1 Tax=Oscarella lobularis TaxID=121494 RepID=UPI003313F82F
MSIQQVAERVINFSSQYGRDGSNAYVAANLAGQASKFPEYGDFMEAFVLRTYGPWWKIAPSASTPLKSRRPEAFISQDFVELEFPTPVFPSKVDIIETYNPGAVVRVLACNASVDSGAASGEIKWVTLWAGPPQQDEIPRKSRIFSPPIKKIDFPTNLLRLEFNHEGLDYYAELDAVELYGTKPSAETSRENRALGFQMERTVKLLKQLSLTEYTPSEEWSGDFGYFGMLPDEVIQIIISYLDTRSLCRAAQTCSLLFRHCYDASLYTELDLKPYWNTVDDCTLKGMQTRCSRLTKLSLSWTGGCKQLTQSAFTSFIETCGATLVCLRLACCDYITADGLKAIVDGCPNLQELDLQSCNTLSNSALKHLSKLTTLQALNLYRVPIENDALGDIATNNKQLQHINLGGCNKIFDFNQALFDLTENCKDLRTLDLWRARTTLTSYGLSLLAKNCPNLEEIDVGWVDGFRSSPDCFQPLFENCTKLKKVFLTAVRSVTNSDLLVLAKHCPLLEQVDVLGNNQIMMESVTEVAKSCKNLKFFDLSFCSSIGESEVKTLRMHYPDVQFKKSFTG